MLLQLEAAGIHVTVCGSIACIFSYYAGQCQFYLINETDSVSFVLWRYT